MQATDKRKSLMSKSLICGSVLLASIEMKKERWVNGREVHAYSLYLFFFFVLLLHLEVKL